MIIDVSIGQTDTVHDVVKLSVFENSVQTTWIGHEGPMVPQGWLSFSRNELRERIQRGTPPKALPHVEEHVCSAFLMGLQV